MSIEKLGFGKYIVVPMNLVFDIRVNQTAKLLFGIIANLSNQRGYCFASNKYLSELTGWHEVTVSKYIKELENGGYILRLDEVMKDRIERRLFLSDLSQTANPPKPNDLDPLSQMANPPLSQTAKHNKLNTLMNKVNDQRLIKSANAEVLDLLPFDSDEFRFAWSEWIEHRKQIRKKLTPKTKEMQLRTLGARPEREAIEMIGRSIQNGWTGLFEINKNGTGINKKQQHDNDLTESVREHYRKKFVERGLQKPGN